MQQLLQGFATLSRFASLRGTKQSRQLFIGWFPVCFVVPPRNDAKRRKREAAEKTAQKRRHARKACLHKTNALDLGSLSAESTPLTDLQHTMGDFQLGEITQAQPCAPLVCTIKCTFRKQINRANRGITLPIMFDFNYIF